MPAQLGEITDPHGASLSRCHGPVDAAAPSAPRSSQANPWAGKGAFVLRGKRGVGSRLVRAAHALAPTSWPGVASGPAPAQGRPRSARRY